MKSHRRPNPSFFRLGKTLGYEKMYPFLGEYKLHADMIERQRRDLANVTASHSAPFLDSISQLQDFIQGLSEASDAIGRSLKPLEDARGLFENIDAICGFVKTLGAIDIPTFSTRRFDERMQGVRLELESPVTRWTEDREDLDRFGLIDPVIETYVPVEDDLIRELQRSRLPDAEEIVRVLEHSERAFHHGDLNGYLNNARVALQTLVTSIAQIRLPSHAGNFDPQKFGQVVTYLRVSGFITTEMERVIVNVFKIDSPGCHRPITKNEKEIAKLGRNLSISICYFLVKQINDTSA